MAHDTTKIVLGQTKSSHKEVTNFNGTVAAGIAVRLKSDGTLSTTLADGNLIGVSLGKDLSDIGRTAICRKGLLVPLIVTNGFTPTLGAQVNISDTTGYAAASGAGATACNAVYASAKMTAGGLNESGSYVDVVLVDFAGGL